MNLLLIHPLQHAAEHRWIRTYARWFHLALFPLLALLLLGTWQRIAEYGITEPRYFLLVLGAWIGAMAAYFTLSRRRDIRVVPISLCLVTLATAIGPWSAYDVSWRDQMRRLTRALEGNGLLAEGRVVRATSDPGSG